MYAFELDFNQIELSRHRSLVSLDSILFLFHFRIHGGLKSRFGGESKEKSPLEAGRDALDVFGD